MILTIVLAAMFATTPAAPQPAPQHEQTIRQPMLAEPTKFYAIADRKKGRK